MTVSDKAHRGPPPDLRDNKIVIRLVLGLLAGGVLLYGLHSYVFHSAPTVQLSAPVR
jgi:hypothetical protein